MISTDTALADMRKLVENVPISQYDRLVSGLLLLSQEAIIAFRLFNDMVTADPTAPTEDEGGP